MQPGRAESLIDLATRETPMPELTRRYVVMTMATEAPFDARDPEGVFVLKPWKDPAALRALAAYRDNCYPELARDLAAWMEAIESGPVVRGDVGRRNEPHVRPAGRRDASSSRDGGAPDRPARRGGGKRPARAAARSARRTTKRPSSRGKRRR